MRNHSFSGFALTTGLVYDNSANAFPTKLHANADKTLVLHPPPRVPSTFYGFIYEGRALLKPDATTDQYPLAAGMYFSVPGGCILYGGNAIVVERIGYKGMFTIGGAIEAEGRLKYIDGCTDSCLLPPVKFGDPCLNALYFPPHTTQTPHTHPSMRVGLVASGRGVCVTPFGSVPLVPGELFVIHEANGGSELGGDGNLHAAGTHSFNTGDEPMVVIAYHPDSDFGPQDENHPMINRTIVGGIPASRITGMRTK